jgi:hypothetical protein
MLKYTCRPGRVNRLKHQNYWVARLCPSFGILKTRKYNISEIGSVSVLR